MGDLDESQIAYDGGWEDGVEAGEGLADMLLGTAHPYDRSDLYTPAHRWGTRHELVGRRFNDPIEALDEQGLLIEDAPDAVVSAVRSERPKPESPKSVSKADGSAACKQLTKTERDAKVAGALGVSIKELRRLRRELSDAVARTKRVASSTPEAECARLMRISPDFLARIREAEALARGNHGRQKRGSSPTSMKVSTAARVVPPTTVSAFWDRYRAIRASVPDLSTAEHRRRASQLLGLSVAGLERFLELTPRTTRRVPKTPINSPVKAGATPRQTHPRRPPSAPVPLPHRSPERPLPAMTMPVCGSCGTQVSINGQCRCS